jgi:hypothetical protein
VFKHFNRGFAANRVLFPFNTVLWFICESCSFSLQHFSVVYLRIVFFFPSTLFCGLSTNRVLFPFNTFLWFICESCSFSLQHDSVVWPERPNLFSKINEKFSFLPSVAVPTTSVAFSSIDRQQSDVKNVWRLTNSHRNWSSWPYPDGWIGLHDGQC